MQGEPGSSLSYGVHADECIVDPNKATPPSMCICHTTSVPLLLLRFPTFWVQRACRTRTIGQPLLGAGCMWRLQVMLRWEKRKG